MGNAPAHQATRKQFNELAASVLRQMESLSFIHVGFLFRSHIEDFVAGVRFLLDLLENLTPDQIAALSEVRDTDEVHVELRPTLRRLCELSREATFATDTSRLQPEFCDAVDKLFHIAASAVPETRDIDVMNHVRNIRERTLHPTSVAS